MGVVAGLSMTYRISQSPKDTCFAVLQTGYKMHDRVLRAAEVGVVAG